MKNTNSLVLKLLRLIGHQNYIRFGLRNRIIRYICNPKEVGSFEFDVDLFTLKYKGDLNCYLDWMIFFYGAYEKYELIFLRDLISDIANPVFIDIGANVGQHSLFMSQYCDWVHAFEPYDLVRQKMLRNIQYNGIKNITVHDSALGNEDVELDYFAPKGSNTGTGSFVKTHAADNNEFFSRLRVRNADNLIDNLQLDKVDLIKIDVEGFEKNVLLGLVNIIAKHRPIVFMEFSAETKCSFAGKDELVSMFPNGYRVMSVLKGRSIGIFYAPKHQLSHFEFDAFSGNIVFFPS